MEQSFRSDAGFQTLKDQYPGRIHDSGYSELLSCSKAETLESKFVMRKSVSFDYLLSGEMSEEKLPQNCALIDGTSSNPTTPRKDRLRGKDTLRSPRKDMKENVFSCGWCETPKTYRKDASLRRRLLVSRAAGDEKLGNSKASNSRLSLPYHAPSREEDTSGGFDSPDGGLFEALVTSTLKNDEVALSCRKRRLVFSQVKTSTLEDGKNKAPLPSASEAEVTEQLAAERDFNESIVSAFPHHLAPESLETPCQSKFTSSTEENFQTPGSDLATNLCNELSILSTPSLTPISKLDTLACEDSGFRSLGLCKSPDSSVDHDSSFQELRSAPRDKESQRAAEAWKRSRLERQRRLSTLKEGGSQSEEDSRPVGPECSHGKLQLWAQGAVVAAEEDDDSFLETTPLGSTKLEDLSLTPALQLVQAMFQRNAKKLPAETTLEDLLCGSESFQTTLPIAGLIGRKMGLGKLDILSELKKMNLRHILAMILNFLSSEDIYRFGQVSKIWDKIILQDKMTNRRRRLYLKDQQLAHEIGSATRVPEAETRLTLLCRSALKPVQAQSKTPVTCTPTLGNGTFTPVQHAARSASRRDEFLQVAKTLFSDECLKSCPMCQRPAKCHSIKREGVCTREDCGFQFCTSCLCAYHGSKDCGSWSAKRRSKKDILPGSAQSKRNIRRL